MVAATNNDGSGGAGSAGPAGRVNSDAGGWEGEETVSLLVNGRQDSYSGVLRQSTSSSIYEDDSDALVAGVAKQTPSASGSLSGVAGRGQGGGASRGGDKSQQIISKLEELLILLKEQQQSGGRL